jgi:uncharacterized protein with ParB-like and HNH nuclease domain
MTKHTLLDTSTVNLAELLGNGRVYRVPAYQRDYSWREESWEDLWLDILALRAREEGRHYMGAVVFQSRSDKEFYVIDGQQRLATLSLIAICVVKKLRELVDRNSDAQGNNERIEILRRTYLGDKDPKSLLYSSKLFLNSNNDNFYQHYILQNREPPNPHRLSDTDKLLYQGMQYFDKKLSELPDVVASGEALAEFLTETVARRLLFIRILVEDELSAFTVFETLNARGVDLTATDLLKNYLFSLIPSAHDLKHVQSQWTRIANIVGTDRFPEFLRHFVNSEQAFIRTERLFKILKDRIKDGKAALDLLDRLEREADVYAAFRDPTHELWRAERAQREQIRVLRIFNVKQLLPLLLAGHRQLPASVFARLLQLCTVISFRYNMIGRLNANELEKVYNEAAIGIHERRLTTIAQIFDALRSVYVSDEKFQNDFASIAIPSVSRRKKLVRYILFQLEADASEQEARDFEDDPATVEHILPENPGAIWSDAFPPDVQEAYIDRLGNYTLLEAGKNRDLKGSDFAAKRSIFATSQYALTRALLQQCWNPDALSRRQEHLAKRAAHIWRYDI